MNVDHRFISLPISKIHDNFRTGKYEIYRKQRDVDFERVNEIAEYLKKHYEENKFVPVRGSLVFCRCNGVYYLIDGQHRYNAYSLLLKAGIDFDVNCEAISAKNEEDVWAEFININKSVPIPVHIIVPQKVVDELVEWTKMHFSHALGDKKKIPIISLEYYKEKLTILHSRCKNNDTLSLIATLTKVEEFLKKESETNVSSFLGYVAGKNTKNINSVMNALKKMNGVHMYIGLYYNDGWIPLAQSFNESIKNL